MLKLLLCLLCALLIGMATLQMRQQQLELKHQAATLQQKIEQQQSKLWNQQLLIATLTSPPAIQETVGHELDLVQHSDLPADAAEWIRRGAKQE
jgi:cell division protein FtsL